MVLSPINDSDMSDSPGVPKDKGSGSKDAPAPCAKPEAKPKATPKGAGKPQKKVAAKKKPMKRPAAAGASTPSEPAPSEAVVAKRPSCAMTVENEQEKPNEPSDPKICKKPAAAKKDIRAYKYLYHKHNRYGVKYNGHEVCTVRPPILSQQLTRKQTR